MNCILVVSADSRADIFDTCFANAYAIWRYCDWPRYVGLNSEPFHRHGFTPIIAPAKEQWCDQVLAYLDVLPKPISHVVLIVEDALFTKLIDGNKLNWIADTAQIFGIKYLRLVPLRRNFFTRWRGRRYAPFQKIDRTEPYYSSSELVLWERDYLRECLMRSTDAWAFEHLVSDVPHYAVWNAAMEQHQIVNKGKWSRLAPKLLKSQGIKIRGNRPMQTRVSQWRGWRENLSFALFGFVSFRFKRWLRS